MSHNHGEIIELVDEDGSIETDNAYIRGHVNPDVAREVYANWYEEAFNEPAPAMGPWRHRYGRWSTECGGTCLRVYKEPGRGRFPITCANQQEASE